MISSPRHKPHKHRCLLTPFQHGCGPSPLFKHVLVVTTSKCSFQTVACYYFHRNIVFWNSVLLDFILLHDTDSQIRSSGTIADREQPNQRCALNNACNQLQIVRSLMATRCHYCIARSASCFLSITVAFSLRLHMPSNESDFRLFSVQVTEYKSHLKAKGFNHQQSWKTWCLQPLVLAPIFLSWCVLIIHSNTLSRK